MKKIIEFFKYIFKLIIGIFFKPNKQENSLKKIEIVIETIEKEINNKFTISIPNDDTNIISIYKEELISLKSKIKNKNTYEKINILLEKIDIVLNKKHSDYSLESFVIISNNLLDMYYDDYIYYRNSDNKEAYFSLLKEKLKKLSNDIKSKGKELDGISIPNDIKKLDKYSLLKNTFKIDNLISSIEKEIVEKKPIKEDNYYKVEKPILKGISDNKEKKKETTLIEKEEIKDKQENDNKSKFEKELTEINKSINYIKKNIEDNETLLIELKEKNKYAIKKIRKEIIKLSFSMFPIALFKNKLIGTLTSAIMLNNTIRTLRKSLDNKIEYIVSNKEDYITNDSITTKIKEVRNDTLMQISLLKEEVHIEYLKTNDISLLEMFDELDKIEKDMKKEEKIKAKVKINNKKY